MWSKEVILITFSSFKFLFHTKFLTKYNCVYYITTILIAYIHNIHNWQRSKIAYIHNIHNWQRSKIAYIHNIHNWQRSKIQSKWMWGSGCLFFLNLHAIPFTHTKFQLNPSILYFFLTGYSLEVWGFIGGEIYTCGFMKLYLCQKVYLNISLYHTVLFKKMLFQRN